MNTYQVATSAALTNDFDAQQIFSFETTVELRRFLSEAPRTGWVYNEESGEMVTAAVYFRVTDLADNSDATQQVANLGWIDSAEIW